MSEIRILSVDKIALESSEYLFVKPPTISFSVLLHIDEPQEPFLENPEIRRALEASANSAFDKFLYQTVEQLKYFDRLFAGMVAKGAAPAEIAKQAENLKFTMQSETANWERSAERDVLAEFNRLVAKL